MNYRITVTVSQMEDGWACTFQLPTFVYEGNVLGITSPEHAKEIAQKTLLQLLPDAGIAVDAVEIDDRDDHTDAEWSR